MKNTAAAKARRPPREAVRNRHGKAKAPRSASGHSGLISAAVMRWPGGRIRKMGRMSPARAQIVRPANSVAATLGLGKAAVSRAGKPWTAAAACGATMKETPAHRQYAVPAIAR